MNSKNIFKQAQRESILPFNEGGSHFRSNLCRLSLVQLENAFYDGYLRAGGVHAAEGRPVVNYHTTADDIASSVHGSSLSHEVRINSCFINNRYRLYTLNTYHKRDL